MRDDVKSQERRATLKKQKVWTRMAEFGVGEKDIENMKQLKRQLSIMLNQNYITQEEYDEYQPMFDILKTYTQVVAVN